MEINERERFENQIAELELELGQVRNSATNKINALKAKQIPGVIAIHTIVTDVCRENRTDTGALLEAWQRVKTEWEAILRIRQKDKGVKYHLILAVETIPGGILSAAEPGTDKSAIVERSEAGGR